MKIHLLEMGGTINGIKAPGLPPPTESRVLNWLDENSERLSFDFTSEFVVMKDSRDVEDTDRELLGKAVLASSEQRILVPHGTFTMPETGVYLQQKLGDSLGGKCVVLVGSLIPLTEPNSDAPENLELAINYLKEPPAGVWIVMSGKLWNPAQVEKHPETGEFVEKAL